MKTYSSADILGRESYLSSLKNPFVHMFESWIEKQNSDIKIHFSIPHHIYLRTKFICDWIETEFKTEFTTAIFVDIIFKDFLYRIMKKHNPIKIYEELSKSDTSNTEIQINDPMNNVVTKINSKKHNVEAELSMFIEKKLLKRGEIILAELDEAVGVHFTVEEVISRLWINFINNYSDGSDERCIEKLIKLRGRYS